jgi:hypothetical protein
MSASCLSLATTFARLANVLIRLGELRSGGIDMMSEEPSLALICMGVVAVGLLLLAVIVVIVGAVEWLFW